jgi:hypothetical protein
MTGSHARRTTMRRTSDTRRKPGERENAPRDEDIFAAGKAGEEEQELEDEELDDDIDDEDDEPLDEDDEP